MPDFTAIGFAADAADEFASEDVFAGGCGVLCELVLGLCPYIFVDDGWV
ncbi:hypothetical protein RQN46_08825 [Arcanobacterium hippocoleae]